MFTNDIIALYSTGNCHLLSYYINKYVGGSNIYILRHDGVVIHSLIFYEGMYHDITGHYCYEEDVYNYWGKCYPEYESPESKKLFSLLPMNHLDELELNQYTMKENVAARIFVEDHMGELVTC